MKMKWNWGTWIVLSFILFAAGTFAMIFIAMSSKVDLVADDYYEKELRYQEHIDVVNETNALEQQLVITLNAAALQISFPRIGPNGSYSGAVHFFRPSDEKSDIILPVSIDSSYTQIFPAGMLTKGLWRIKVSWSAGDRRYYSEQPVVIQ